MAALGELPAGVTRLQASEQAREKLRARLLHLLVNGQTVGPAVEYVAKRTAVLHEQRVQEQEVRWRRDDVYNEMFRHELHVLDLDGSPAGPVAMLAAENNLAVRRLALDDELHTALARIQGKAARKIERLLENLEDASEA